MISYSGRSSAVACQIIVCHAISGQKDAAYNGLYSKELGVQLLKVPTIYIVCVQTFFCCSSLFMKIGQTVQVHLTTSIILCVQGFKNRLLPSRLPTRYMQGYLILFYNRLFFCIFIVVTFFEPQHIRGDGDALRVTSIPLGFKHGMIACVQFNNGIIAFYFKNGNVACDICTTMQNELPDINSGWNADDLLQYCQLMSCLNRFTAMAGILFLQISE